ncbi:MAG: hypothetical protein ACRD19_11535 [Terriglobia bacterium]
MTADASVARALDIVMIVATAVKEARSIPSGTLYAAVCAKISLTEYDGAIRLLKRQGLISEKHHILTWEEP